MFTADTYVMLSTGELASFSSLMERRLPILSYDFQSGKLITDHITDVYQSESNRPVLHSDFRNGVFLDCTEDQLFLSPLHSWNPLSAYIRKQWDVYSIYNPTVIESSKDIGMFPVFGMKTQSGMFILSNGFITKC